jgi:hypothetical protein
MNHQLHSAIQILAVRIAGNRHQYRGNPCQQKEFSLRPLSLVKIRFWTGMISHRSEIVVGCARITEDPWQESGLFIQNL